MTAEINAMAITQYKQSNRVIVHSMAEFANVKADDDRQSNFSCTVGRMHLSYMLWSSKGPLQSVHTHLLKPALGLQP